LNLNVYFLTLLNEQHIKSLWEFCSVDFEKYDDNLTFGQGGGVARLKEG